MNSNKKVPSKAISRQCGASVIQSDWLFVGASHGIPKSVGSSIFHTETALHPSMNDSYDWAYISVKYNINQII